MTGSVCRRKDASRGETFGLSTFPYERPLSVPASNPFAVNPFDAPVVVVGYSFAETNWVRSRARDAADSSEFFLSAEDGVRIGLDSSS